MKRIIEMDWIELDLDCAYKSDCFFFVVVVSTATESVVRMNQMQKKTTYSQKKLCRDSLNDDHMTMISVSQTKHNPESSRAHERKSYTKESKWERENGRVEFMIYSYLVRYCAHDHTVWWRVRFDLGQLPF